MSTVGFGGCSALFKAALSPTPLALQAAVGQTSPDKTVNCRCTTASFTVLLEPVGFVVMCQLTQESRPSMTFLSVGSQLCRWLPSDPPSRERPCLKLVVIVTRIFELIIWTLVLLQGTFTPLVHAHAGRTQNIASESRSRAFSKWTITRRDRVNATVMTVFAHYSGSD